MQSLSRYFRHGLKKLFTTTSDPVLLFDKLGEVVQSNCAAVRLLGTADDTLIGRSLQELVQPEDLESVNAALRATTLPQILHVGLALNTHGSRSTKVMHLVPVVENGNTYGLCGIVLMTETHASPPVHIVQGRRGSRQLRMRSATGSQAAVKRQMKSDLGRCVERDELRLHYQPIVSLLHQDVVGMEALVRWVHPQKGLISPAEFIPLAEETGLIHEVGRWVIHEACRQAQEWQERCQNKAFYVSVNISAQELQRPDFLPFVCKTLITNDLAPSSLHFELTEGTRLSPDPSVLETLQALRGLGLKVAIDDFGVGYSSLSYLKQLRVDAVKVDRSFVADIAHNLTDRVIMHAILDIARTLDLNVVAEGVESQEQLRLLSELGCHSVQGYLFAPPLPPEEAALMLSQSIVTQRTRYA